MPARVEVGQAALQRLEVVELAEVHLDVEARREKHFQHALIDRLGARELFDLFGRALAERFIGEIVDRGADDREARRQQALLGEVVERGQELATAQVAAGTEDDHEAWLTDPVVV